MAQVNQDFITYVGDSPQPIFTVVDASGKPVDISGAYDIQWSVRRNVNDPVVLTKNKRSGGTIVFVTDGTNGQFQVPLTTTDTSALSGWYVHVATLLTGPSGGTVVTVTVGRMMVGIAPNWTQDDASAKTETLYLVRAMIGDVIQSDQLLSDQLINVVIGRYSVTELAAAECCRMIAARYSREVDLVQGQLKTNYSQKAKSYMALNYELSQIGYARGGGQAYTGGTSLTDKDNSVSNTDRVPPQFNIGMFDNLLPESPIGHEVGAGQANEQDFISDVGQL